MFENVSAVPRSSGDKAGAFRSRFDYFLFDWLIPSSSFDEGRQAEDSEAEGVEIELRSGSLS